MGAWFPSAISKAKMWAEGGMWELIDQWFWKAISVLQGQHELVQRISLPFGCVFFLGAQKE